MRIIIVVGARPNFMKIAPVISAIEKHKTAPGNRTIERCLVHTGQHYDYEMSQVFFNDLGLPDPDIHLGVGGGTHTEQTAKVMLQLEKAFITEKPDVVMVVGDVNSTLAGALVAAKMRLPLAHVEAGLRSYDRDMPEEINRLLTDAVSDYLFTPSRDADANLKKEGIPEEKIFLVGNVMVDSLLASRARADKSPVLTKLGLHTQEYAVLTLHRPGNVDDKDKLTLIIRAVHEVARKIRVVFPIHPRTRKNLEAFGLNESMQDRNISFIEPLGYIDFLKLEMDARFVMTDSGGVQEETTALGIPCLTLRDSTERPVTVSEGTNIVVADNRDRLIEEVDNILGGRGKRGKVPYLWDGRTAERIIGILVKGETQH
jgi:UDP-N-acetylglucosamine 2-epimerase (non-hydrolysing)